MKKLKQYFLLSGAALAVFSCEIPFDLDDVSEPAFYIQFLPSPDGASPLVIGYAEPAFGKKGSLPYQLDLSDVSVTADGVRVPSAEFKDSTAWNKHFITLPASFRPSAGTRVEVAVKGKGVAQANASTLIPPAPDVKDVSLSLEMRDSSRFNKVSIKLSAPVEEGEYYGLMARSRTTVISVSGTSILDAVTDTTVYSSCFSPGRMASFSDLNSLDLDDYASVDFSDRIIEGSSFSRKPLSLLSARQFDGDTYIFYTDSFDVFDWSDIDFDLEGDYPDVNDDYEMPEDPQFFYMVLSEKVEYCFELWRLSGEFYNYAKAQYLSTFNMLSNFGVSPPNFTYSNVLGGLGVVAGCSVWASPWIEAPSLPDEN